MGRVKLHSNFGKKLKIARENANLTQQQLSENMNISIDTVKNWEQDYDIPRTNTIIELSEILNCDLDYLIGNQKEPKKEYEHLAKMTGLSYNAASSLSDMARQGNDLLPIISAIIENPKLLYCIESAVYGKYQDGYIQQTGKRNLFVKGKTLYNADKAAASEELLNFIDNFKENLPEDMKE